MSISKQWNLVIKRNYSAINYNFVPKHDPPTPDDVQLLKDFVDNSKKLLVLTGAGISTESGIPDYRSEGVGLYARTNHRPIQYLDFLKSAETRQRYWARNYIGWPIFSHTQPNHTHYSLTKLQQLGNIDGIVTQNVDGLHTKAGSQNVIELHGTAYRVICLNCGRNYRRHDVQKTLDALNPNMWETVDMIRPDGDVELAQDKVENFHPPFCDHCNGGGGGGILKPDIIFFGDNVPKERVDLVRDAVTRCDSLLILGSSLSVYSGYRFVLQARDQHKNIGIVNIGGTRADQLADLKISTRCGEILAKIV